MSKSTHFMKLKQINVEMIKTALKEQEYSTKSSIAHTTGLSVATCGNILKELLVTEEVFEIDFEASTGGRPARRFVYNENFANVVALFPRIEGDVKSISCAVSNMLGEYVYEKSTPYSDITIKEIDETIEMLLRKFPNIKVIALGIPGVVHKGKIGFCDFDKLVEFPIKSYLNEKYQLEIVVENDMNSTALGFYKKISEEKPESMAYIYFPKDSLSGAGIIVNGQIIKGHSNFAGEVAYLPLKNRMEAQRPIQKYPAQFADLVSKMIASINSVINPEHIVLTGYYFNDTLIELIKVALTEFTPSDHMPELFCEDDIHDSYIYGLTSMGLNKLSCRIEIVERH